MSKHDEIVDKIVERLRFQDEHGVDFHQEPYKGDFFRLFVEAAEEGDGLRAARLKWGAAPCLSAVVPNRWASRQSSLQKFSLKFASA
jgi:hypothetical protein